MVDQVFVLPGNLFGREAFFYEGYKLIKRAAAQLQGAPHVVIHLDCREPGCPFNLEIRHSTREQGRARYTRQGEHNHPSVENLYENAFFRSELNKAVEEDTVTPLRQLYEGLLDRYSFDRQMVPPFKSMRQSLRSRRYRAILRGGPTPLRVPTLIPPAENEMDREDHAPQLAEGDDQIPPINQLAEGPGAEEEIAREAIDIVNVEEEN